MRRKKNVIRILLTALFYNDLWEPYYSTGEHLSVDETIISGYIMRRRSGGGMIYRAMTEDEIRDAAWDQANQI